MSLKSLLASSSSRHAFTLRVLLCSSLCAPFAYAQEISTETTTPVQTSTANGGSPSDVTVTEDGSIVLTGTEGVAAITIDSDNSVTHDGAIEINDTNNVTGILITPNRTADLTVSGSIDLLEEYEREDDDDDDDEDGPLAIGENRVAVLLEPGGTHTGDIEFEIGSTIDVEGNNSAGIQLQSALDGNFVFDGLISITGEETVAIEIDEGVTGDVLVSGNIATTGTNSRGVSVDGDVGGALTIESAVSSTGFANSLLSNYVAPINLTDDTLPLEERIDAEDINPNGTAVAVGGSVANGILVNGAVEDLDPDEDDETKDTIEDFNENRGTGSIASIGSAPALQISPDLDGDATGNITIGTVVETVRDTLDDDDDDDITETLATFNYDQGLINRGSITGNGLNVGFSATGLQVRGSEDGVYTTTITGGILNAGTITANAAEADATAVHLGSGAIIGDFINDGSIGSVTNTIDGHSAVAILIDDGADLSSLTNTGIISGTSVGDSGDGVGIRDLSNGLSTIENTGLIRGLITQNGLAETELGRAIAIDLSSSSQDVTISQFSATPVIDTNGDDVIDGDDVADPSIVGDVLFGSGNDTFSIRTGSMTGNTEFGLGDGELSIIAADYEGDVVFSDGTNSVLLERTALTGDLTFGGVSGTFMLDRSTFEGQLISQGALQSLTAIDSDILLSEGTSAMLDSLSITGDSLLQVSIDPRTNPGAALTVTNGATIGEGVTIRPDLLTIADTDFSFTFIDAGTLTYNGVFDDSVIEDTPFIYNVDLTLNDADRDTLVMEFILKTPDELGFDANQAAAYNAVLDVFASNDDLGAALADITDEADFQQTYNLLLPQRTDAATRFLSSQGTAAFGALGNRVDAISDNGERNRGLWAQEYFTQIDVDPGENVPGYNGNGLGFAAGIDRRFGPLDIAGVFVNYSSGDFEEKTGGTNPVTTSSLGLGLYTKESFGPIDVFVSGQYSSVEFNSRRSVELADLTYEQRADWTGTSGMASIGVSSKIDAGNFFARPRVSVDYFQLSQDAYSETGTVTPAVASADNDANRLALSIGEAESDRLSASAVVELGTRLQFDRRSGAYVIPQVTLGYRSEFSSSPYSTTANFIGSDETFNITAFDTFEDALLAGFSISTDSTLGSARFGYDIEIADEGVIHFGGATLKLKF